MFIKAKPIWLKGHESDMHLRVEFKEVLYKIDKMSYTVRVATSGVYRLIINGELAAYGPARAGKGHFRMDVLEINNRLKEGTNILILEVCGYNANGYSIQNQKSFVQAEIHSDNVPLLYTGKHFTARINPYYVRKTPRYSFQRPMIECYRIPVPTAQDRFYLDPMQTGEPPEEINENHRILPRNVSYPQYETEIAKALLKGTAQNFHRENIVYDRSQINVGEKILGFALNELEMNPVLECQHFLFSPSIKEPDGCIKDGTYEVYKFSHNCSGFIRLKVFCESSLTLYLTADELLSPDNQVDFLRAVGYTSAFRFDLCHGKHDICLLEPYVMQFLQLHSCGGCCYVREVGMIEFKHPSIAVNIQFQDEKLQRIAYAGVETFRQNAIDIYMDCPSRERAGWLCDSFFMGRAEYFLTGQNIIERNFLENFLHEDQYAYLPKGMVPACYPADHYDGMYIPNWAMWLVLEIGEYCRRSKTRDIADSFQAKVYQLICFFENYRNEDGLLENLDGWVFIEWSNANNFVKGVSYPTNMLYSAMLRTAGELYDDKGLLEKSNRIKSTVLKQSYKNGFFVDNAVRKNGKLYLNDECSEVCQYYAFFFNIATPESHQQLFQHLTGELGPSRKPSEMWPDMHPAAPFFGLHLRFDILMRYGYEEKAKSEIVRMCGHMAESTGTLWEHAQSNASCSHGIMSHVLCFLNTSCEKLK